jgi:hypothetical protein
MTVEGFYAAVLDASFGYYCNIVNAVNYSPSHHATPAVFLHYIKNSAHFTVFATTLPYKWMKQSYLAEIYNVYCDCNSEMRKVGHKCF